MALAVLWAFSLQVPSAGSTTGVNAKEGGAERPAAPAAAAAGDTTAPADSSNVLVAYYFHRSLRCDTCIRMERAIADVIAHDFARDRERGRLRLESVDYEEPAHLDLVEAYELGDGPALILSRQRDGRELAHEALPEIWDWVDDPIGLSELLHEELAAALDTLGRSAARPEQDVTEEPDVPAAATGTAGGRQSAPGGRE